MFNRNFLLRQTQQSLRTLNMRAQKPLFVRSLASRAFSQSIKPPQVNYTGMYLLSALGIGGIAFTCLKGRSMMKMTESEQRMQGQTFMSPIVQSRVATTLSYFGYGLGFTGAVVAALRNSARAASVHPFLILPFLLGAAIGTYSLDYQTQRLPKIACYSALCGIMGLNILPLVQMSSMAVVADAALATGVSMSAFAAIAYNAPSEQFLMYGGAIGILSGCMLGVSLLGMLTGSKALFNIWLYGGLAMAGVYTLYDTQKIIYNAKNQLSYDPINNSLEIYMDAVMFFVRFLILMNNNKKK